MMRMCEEREFLPGKTGLVYIDMCYVYIYTGAFVPDSSIKVQIIDKDTYEEVLSYEVQD